MNADKLESTGRFRRPPKDTSVVRPASLKALAQCFDRTFGLGPTFRPRGAGTASTDCNAAPGGTVIDMTAFDRITGIDNRGFTVTVQSGVRLGQLVAALAAEGLELEGCYDNLSRTVGGAIAAPCFGPGIGGDAIPFASRVTSLKLLMPSGRLMTVSPSQQNLLNALRTSYGLLGIIYEATISVRPIELFSVSHRRVELDKFIGVIDTLAASDVGMSFYLMPFRNRVYLDLRRRSHTAGKARRAPWRIKDWGESTVLPNMLRSLNRVVPMQSMRYRLVDSLSEATQKMVNNRLTTTGSYAAAGAQRLSDPGDRGVFGSAWCFPAAEASVVIRAYVDFCRANYAASGYRCDLPTVGCLLRRDPGSLLSPAFDEPMIALKAMSTDRQGWEDSVIDLAEFAAQWGGIPLFNQSRSVRADHARQAYSGRIEFFRQMRRRLDPDNRLLNPFLAQYFQ